MKNKRKIIGILGGGKWGTTLGKKFRGNFKVKIYSKDINPSFKKVRNLEYFRQIDKIEESNFIIVAVPSFAIREVITLFRPFYSGQPILGVSKGIEKETGKLSSQIVEEILGKVKYAHLSGPSFATEVVKGLPVGFNLGLSNLSQKRYFQEFIELENFKIRIIPDLIGVQLGGALKNIIAIFSGISEGLGMGDNFRALLIWQGFKEMMALGKKMGAKEKTFLDLSGLGDLILTATSVQSRNYRAGLKIGKQNRINLKELRKETVEGLDTTFAASRLAEEFKLNLPIIKGVFKIVYQRKDPRNVLNGIREEVCG